MTAPSIYEFLDQDTYWGSRVNGELVTCLVEEMTPRHLANTRNWLLDNAENLLAGLHRNLFLLSSMVSGEMAADDLDREMTVLEDTGSEEWMREQPLFMRIEKLLEIQAVDQ